MQQSLAQSEESRVRFESEKGALEVERAALAAKVDKMETLQAMQAEEIARLSLEAGKTTMQIEGGLTVSEDSMIKLTHKVDQLRFEYLEKEREL